MSEEKIPVKNEAGFYEIRFESIGGFGANLAGKMLAEAAILGQGLNGSNFAQYGSEKKGTPVKSYVRLAEPDKEIRNSAPVEEPHLLAVFNLGLTEILPVTSGLEKGGVVSLLRRLLKRRRRKRQPPPPGSPSPTAACPSRWRRSR